MNKEKSIRTCNMKSQPTAYKKEFILADGFKYSSAKPTAYVKRFTLNDDIKGTSDGWKTKPMGKWVPIDVMNWLMNWADSNELKYEEIKMHKFNFNGRVLLNTSEKEFIKLDESHGKDLHKELQRRKLKEQESISSGNVKRGRGRPVGSSSKVAKPKIKRCRLWEFLIELLSSSEYCPSVIEWENQDVGLFRIKQSDKVAQLWGDSRGKKNMDYVKMSRLMRYYYKNQELQADKQRLVYRFGPNAVGWQSQKIANQK